MLHVSMILYFFGLLMLGATAAFFSGLLGIGGGIFYVLGLDELFVRTGIQSGMSMHLALGSSTCVNVFNALINITRHRKHQAINWTVVKHLMPTMVIGAFVGGYVAGYLPTNILKIFFALFLFWIGLQYTFKAHRPSVKPVPGKISLAIVGLLMGTVASINGLGGGVIIVPFLHRYNLQMHEIVAISAACILPQSLFGTLGYMISGWGVSGLPEYTLGYVYWPVVVPLVITSLIFVPIGVKLVHSLPHERTRRIFGLLLLAMCSYMLYSIIARS